MSNSFQIEKRRNKKFIISNSELLKQYAITNRKNLGRGIIVINLLLIENDVLKVKDLEEQPLPSGEDSSSTLKQPIAYIPLVNFWFKIIRLKIKNKPASHNQQQRRWESAILLIVISAKKSTNITKYYR